jgi:hypothetical protein
MAKVDNFIYMGEKINKNAVESPSKKSEVCQCLVSKMTKQEVKPAACDR